MIRYTDGIITINEEDYLAAKKMCRNKNAMLTRFQASALI